MAPELEAAVGNRNRRIYEMKMSLATLSLGILFSNFPDTFKPGGPLSLLTYVAPPGFWGALFTVLGTARLVALIVNGVWPLGPTVRWSLSITTLCLVWAPLVAGYWSALSVTHAYPTLILGPIALIGEANCLFALSALREGQRRAE